MSNHCVLRTYMVTANEVHAYAKQEGEICSLVNTFEMRGRKKSHLKIVGLPSYQHKMDPAPMQLCKGAGKNTLLEIPWTEQFGDAATLSFPGNWSEIFYLNLNFSEVEWKWGEALSKFFVLTLRFPMVLLGPDSPPSGITEHPTPEFVGSLSDPLPLKHNFWEIYVQCCELI